MFSGWLLADQKALFLVGLLRFPTPPAQINLRQARVLERPSCGGHSRAQRRLAANRRRHPKRATVRSPERLLPHWSVARCNARALRWMIGASSAPPRGVTGRCSHLETGWRVECWNLECLSRGESRSSSVLLVKIVDWIVGSTVSKDTDEGLAFVRAPWTQASRFCGRWSCLTRFLSPTLMEPQIYDPSLSRCVHCALGKKPQSRWMTTTFASSSSSQSGM